MMQLLLRGNGGKFGPHILAFDYFSQLSCSSSNLTELVEPISSLCRCICTSRSASFAESPSHLPVCHWRWGKKIDP